MKKLFIVLLILVIFISFIMISYNIILANNKVEDIEDIIVMQNNIDKKISSYGYTIDNPNIIINPYKISPLTALIIFETLNEEEVSITIPGKSELTTYKYTFSKNTRHYIPVYGLYPDYNNEIIISYGEVSKIINIKTDKLPNDFILPTNVTKEESKLNNDLYFYTPSSKGYTCAYDVNGDVRWYLNKNFIWEINRLKNGHLLLSTDRLINNPYYTTGLVEIDLLGKIYYEYNIEGGYHHDYFELPNGNLLVLSNDFSSGKVEDYIVEIDCQNGNIVKQIDLKKILPEEDGKSENWSSSDWFHNNSVWYDEKTNSITLSGRHQDVVVNLDYETYKINWLLGDSTNWSDEYKQYFLKPIGDDFEWQWSQHAVSITPEGYVFLFDNGNNKSKIESNYVSSTNSYSRGVMYQIDLENKTIKQIWQYGKERGSAFYSPYISDVDYIESNHYIVHSGGISYVNGKNANYPAGLVNADKLVSDTIELLNDNIIFELVLPTNNYRVEKMPLYQNTSYQIKEGVTLGNIPKTVESSNNIALVKYRNSDSNYQKYNIAFSKEKDRLVFTGTFSKDDEVKIILDKFLGKKTYDVIISKTPYKALCVDIFNNNNNNKNEKISISQYIYNTGLKGKYSIYVYINKTIYKTNNYVIF